MVSVMDGIPCCVASDEREQAEKKLYRNKNGQEHVSPSLQADAPLLRERVRRLLDQEVDFVSNKFFGRRSAARFFEQESLDLAEFENGNTAEVVEKLPAHVSRLCQAPLLTPEQEVRCFRRMNYLKFRLHQSRGQLNLDQPDEELVLAAEGFREQALKLRDVIIRANLRLVVSVTRKFVTPQFTFDELFSEGVLALMNAVEKFDYDRGYRFSTYAYYSISRGMYRLIKALRKKRILLDVLDQNVAAAESRGGELNSRQWDDMSQELRDMLKHLDHRERWIIQQRYALDDMGKAPTYRMLAEQLGICNERVRQLEKRALSKLRGLGEDGRFNEVLDTLDI